MRNCLVIPVSRLLKPIAALMLCAALAACGGGGGGNAAPAPPPVAPAATGTLQVVAAQAFNYPFGIVADAAGDLYVSDITSNQVFKITPDGTISVFAGTPYLGVIKPDGLTPATRLYGPAGMARDAAGNFFVADKTGSVIRKITADGTISVFAGTPLTPGSIDGTASAALFNGPTGITLNADGNFYVADYLNNNIRKITPAGVVTTMAGTAGVHGHADGTGSAATFYEPNAITSDAAGNLYVADTMNSIIRKIIPDGTVTTLAGQALVPGYADGTGATATFLFPYGIAADSAGNLYVGDADDIRKVTPSGVVTTVVGGVGGSYTAVPQSGPLPGSIDGYAIGVTVIDPHNLAFTTPYSVYRVTFN